ncbi:MAG: response regulator, partial [Gammaproteobacteria bacterium]|nr:response regulator [Gammaproteobacteria bacterium]
MDNKIPLLLISPDLRAREALLNKISSLQMFDVHTVMDSRQAISKLKQLDFRFIISEINIGEIDAWRLSSLIRSDIYICNKKTPIVLITDTHYERIAEATAKSFGINAVLAKSDSAAVNEILADAFSTSLPVIDKLKILTISSNETLNSQLESLFAPRYIAEFTHSAKEGLSIIRQTFFDLVIVDASLEDEAAMPLLKTITYEQSDFPVVMLVPRNDTEAAENFLVHGASDFIYEPINPVRIFNICERTARRNDFMISNIQFAEKVQKLEESEQEYKRLSSAHTQLLGSISSVVMELDQSGNIKFLNPAWFRLTGYTIEESLNKSLLSFLDASEEESIHFSNKLSDLLVKSVYFNTEEVKIKTKHSA